MMAVDYIHNSSDLVSIYTKTTTNGQRLPQKITSMLLKPLLQAKHSKDTQLPKETSKPHTPIHTKRPPLEEEKTMARDNNYW
jgi:hypothetical protein